MFTRSLLIVFLLMTASGTLFLSFYSTRKLRSSSAIAFILFMLSECIYSLGYAFELSQDTIDGIFLALKIEYLGIPFLSVFWFILALRYNGYNKKKPLLFAALFIIPLTTTIMLFTNNFHHFHYRDLSINYTGLFPVAEMTKGFWYYIDYIYKNILIFSGILLFFRMIGKTTGYRRKQAIIIFTGSLIPGFGNIMALSGMNPYGIDMNPFYIAFAVPIFGYAMFRLRIFDIAPIARDRIFEEMKDPVIVLDRQNRIADYNSVAGNLLPELRKDTTGLFIHDVLINYSTFINKIISPDNKKGEVEFNRDGTAGFYSISTTKLFSKVGRHIGFIIMLHDITEHKYLLEKLHNMATIDALTQIYNRRFFMELSLNEMKRMNRYQRSLSMLMIDIDFFKKVNDTYGHPAGDLILMNTAASFKKILRDCDIPGRYGGEEFTILLPETDASGAASIAERLREYVSSFENIYQGVKISITVSIGISHIKFDTPGDNNDYGKILDSLLYESDQALYQAKEQGRNQVRTYISP